MSEHRTALIVRGGWDGHDPIGVTEFFTPFLVDNGYRVTVSETLDTYLDADLLAATDLIVQCWTMGTITDEQLTGLRTAIANGTGFAGWHGGIADAFRSSTFYLQLVGGQFVDHPGGIRDFDVAIRDAAASHPIVAGLSGFRVESEQYWVLSDALNDVLAETTIPAEGPWGVPVTVPTVWTRPWGLGKIFVSTVGHRLSDFDVPEVRTITERGLLWASR
jgi:type 1 glutamine amidotransferase